MDEIDLYKMLSEINMLTADIYSKLLNVYGEKLVNYVIEKMIDNDSELSDKFAYYIDRILSYDNNVVVKNLFDAYMLDVSTIPSLTAEENIVKVREIHKIVHEIDELLGSSRCNIIKSSWISDRIDDFLKKSSDKDLINKVSKLYNKFIYKRNLLVEGNLKLVIAFGKHFYKSGDDFNDLIQYGNLGLMKAIEKFDPIHNTSLSTYSYHWIKQSITRNMPVISCPVSIPYKFIAMSMSINKVVKKLFHEKGEEPTNEEIANYMGISVDKVVEVRTLFMDALSLNDFAVDSDNSVSDSMFIDIIEDKNAIIEKKIFFDEMSKELIYILKNSLTDKEYKVICSRFGLFGNECKTLEEIGEELGVTRERVRQIEKKVVCRKLKNKCSKFKNYFVE